MVQSQLHVKRVLSPLFNANCIQKQFPETEIKLIILYADVCHSLQKDHVPILHHFDIHAACSHEWNCHI